MVSAGARIMILTGIINSEIAHLLKSNIHPYYIQVQNTIVRGREQETPITRYRISKIPITQANRKRLDILTARANNERFVTTKSGTIFRPANFRKDIW
jgi:integrase